MKISVIIPSFNRANFLERTIESVVKQTYKNFEIIVVDDCSTDNTSEVVRCLKNRLKEIDIIYVKHEINKGESGARNTGIKIATGKYIAFLDSDDAWCENKLIEQLKFLNNNFNKYDGVLCEYFSISKKNAASKETISFLEDELQANIILTRGCGYGVGTNLFIKREKIVELFDENLKLFADMDWLYRILNKCKIGVIHKPLAFYYKSPMRSGDFVKEHAEFFLIKYNEVLKNMSFFEKRYCLSTMNWYIAVAYDVNKNFKAALRHYIVGFWFMPFRRLGNYFHVLKLWCYLLIT